MNALFNFISFLNSSQNAKIALSSESSHLRIHPVASEPHSDAPDEEELFWELEAEIENEERSLREQGISASAATRVRGNCLLSLKASSI